MSYTVFTDGCSNLPGHMLSELDIRVLPCSYVLDGVPGTYDGNIDGFNAHAYYDKLRGGAVMKTSLLNTHLFLTHFRPELENGNDVIYVGMSSGISGTIQAARIAVEELSDEFPDRTVRVVDSLGAAFGPGLLACRASDLRSEGKTASEAADILDQDVFFRTVKASFAMRRKKLANGLASGFPELGKTGAAEVIAAAGFPENVRGETLSIPEFARIANEIVKFKQK